MAIQIGDRIPEVNLKHIQRDAVETVDTNAFFANRDVLLFSVPGAFTPTCSEQHLPGYIAHFDAFRDKGVAVAVMSVNDPFVMKAWVGSHDAPQAMEVLADGNGEFAVALGLQMDASAYGMGIRSKRFALLARDGVVQRLEVEAPGELRVSSAEHMLSLLD